MPEKQPIDQVFSLIEGYAQGCLDDLLAAGAIPRAAATARACKGWTVRVSVFPARDPAAEGPVMTPCDRDCLELLRRAQLPLTAEQVRDALEKQDVGVYAEITVKRSLARLHKRLHLIG